MRQADSKLDLEEKNSKPAEAILKNRVGSGEARTLPGAIKSSIPPIQHKEGREPSGTEDGAQSLECMETWQALTEVAWKASGKKFSVNGALVVG